MQATITGIDQLSNQIRLDLDSRTKVASISDNYPVSLDQAKQLSRYLNILKKARKHSVFS
jgi:hypothetical protein